MDTNFGGSPHRGLRVAITGGTSGLGLALVRELGRRGARVAFIARHRERVESVAREEPGAFGIVGDVSSKEDIYPLATQILGNLGGLDALVNNASDLGPVPLALLGDTDCEDLERALATNVLGPFRLTKALLGALAAAAREGRGAVVLNISSDAAINPYPRWGAYGASKAAIESYSRAAAKELGGYGITVNIVSPGPIQTGWIAPDLEKIISADTPLGRVGHPDDVADVIVFLASEQARWLTGQLISVSGGHRMV